MSRKPGAQHIKPALALLNDAGISIKSYDQHHARWREYETRISTGSPYAPIDYFIAHACVTHQVEPEAAITMINAHLEPVQQKLKELRQGRDRYGRTMDAD